MTGNDAPSARSLTSATLIKARCPADVLATFAYAIGYHPTESLVLAALEGARHRVGLVMRVDLPVLGSPVRAAAAHLVGVLTRHGVNEVLLVAYAATSQRAAPMAAAVMHALQEQQIVLCDAWRADGGRWFSYTCTDHACCPEEGTPYETSATSVAAHAVFLGGVAAPDRETLRASIDRVPDSAQAMRAATRRAAAELADVTAPAPGARDRTRVGMAWVDTVVSTFVADPRPLGDDECARLSLWVTDVAVRDVAWCRMRHQDIQTHVDLWTQVTRRAVPGLVAAPASLLGFACWLQGQGTVARMAVDRALAEDPHYSMALLLQESLDRALPPSVWTAAPIEQVYACAGVIAPPSATESR